MALQFVGTGLGLVRGLFGFGHAKAVARENNALGAADSFIQKELGKLEVDAREGRITERNLDARLQAVLDGYYQTVAGVIKGRIASEADWNPASKKTKTGGPCNAACVTGGQYADALQSARPALLKLISGAKAEPKTIQASGKGYVSGNGRQGEVPVKQAGVASFTWRDAFKCAVCIALYVAVPGALAVYLFMRLLKRRRNA